MSEAAGDNRYNTAVIIDPDGTLIGRYRKQAVGHEVGRNTPGIGNPVFETSYGTVGIMICADLLIIPSGGMCGRRNDGFVRDRSRENAVPIVFVHPAEFLVTAPNGKILARALLGDQLVIDAEERDGAQDSRAVYYFDVDMASDPNS